MIATQTDHFLSEEDLDLQAMTMDELVAWWNIWLEQAQITNELDQYEYSHGVFRHEPRTAGSRRQTTDDSLPAEARRAKAGRRTEEGPERQTPDDRRRTPDTDRIASEGGDD